MTIKFKKKKQISFIARTHTTPRHLLNITFLTSTCLLEKKRFHDILSATLDQAYEGNHRYRLPDFVVLIFCWEEDTRKSSRNKWMRQLWEWVVQIFFQDRISMLRLLCPHTPLANNSARWVYLGHFIAQRWTHLGGRFCSGASHPQEKTIKVFSELHQTLRFLFTNPSFFLLFIEVKPALGSEGSSHSPVLSLFIFRVSFNKSFV